MCEDGNFLALSWALRGSRIALHYRLETAIVLIAFVVVASVFAFAVLTTGVLSSGKSKEAVIGALEGAGSTLRLSTRREHPVPGIQRVKDGRRSELRQR